MSENQEQIIEQTNAQTQQPVVVQVVQQPQAQQSGLCIAGFIVSFFSGIIGMILSVMGIRKCNKEGLRGKGFGIAGITISAIKLIIIGFYLLIFLFMSIGYRSIPQQVNQPQVVQETLGQKSVDPVNNNIGEIVDGQ